MSRSLVLSLSLALAALTPAVAADTFEVDAVHSGVNFTITHLKVSRFHGRFNELAGKVVFDPADPTKSAVEITVKAASVDTGNAARDKHLRSQDFFSSEEFPEITFKGAGVKAAGENSFEVKGTLTFHGVSKEITVVVEHVATGPGMKGETRAGFEARFTIKRSEYGMDYSMGALGDDVSVVVWVEGVKK